MCIATSGPGASHLITGLYDARMNHMPVLAIAARVDRRRIGSVAVQGVEMRPVGASPAAMRLENISLFWHLMDGIWILLFPTLYLVGR